MYESSSMSVVRSLALNDSPGIFWTIVIKIHLSCNLNIAHRAESDGSMSASGSADPGFDPRRGSKFSFENFQPWG